MNLKKSNYEITFKKLDIREIKACIEKIKDDIELKLKKVLLDSNLSIEGGTKSKYDGTGKLKLIIPNNIPDEQRIIEETIYKNPRLKSLIKQVEYLTGIVQNPSVLPEYTRGFLTKSYQKITGDELEKFIVLNRI